MISAASAGRILQVRVGAIAPLGPDKVASGFVKSEVAGPVSLSETGFFGDFQADLVNHGGVSKAVYAYPVSHYPLWADDFPAKASLFAMGSMGENLPWEGMTEDDICLGDVFRLGTAIVQVSQPRRPCFKLALRFDEPRLPQEMTRNGRSGWYLRVLQNGAMAGGDLATLLERPCPTWSIRRLNTMGAARRVTPEIMAELARLELLPDAWRVAIPGLRDATEAARQDRPKD